MNTVLIKVLTVVAIAGLGFTAGKSWEHRARVAEVAQIRAEVATQAATRQDVGIQAQRAEDKKQDGQIAAVGKIDTQRTQELARETATINSQRAGVAAGTQRVRIVASCPAGNPGGDNVPAASTAAGLGNATTVELAPDSGQLVLNLQQAIAEDQKKILALQDIIRVITAPTAP